MITEAIAGFMQGTVKPILDKWIPDASERLKAEQFISASLVQLDLGQMEVNKAEAVSTSFFVAGWRPAIGWICGGAYAYTFVIQPFLAFILAATGHPVHELPKIDMGELSFVLIGMLGLGAMRSFDKTQK